MSEIKIDRELERGKIYVLKGVGDDANLDGLDRIVREAGCGMLLLKEGQSLDEYKEIAVKMAVNAVLDEIEGSQLPLIDLIELIRERYN